MLIDLRLCRRDVGDVDKTVLSSFKFNSFFHELTGQSLSTIGDDLDGERKLSLQTHAQSTPVWIDQIDVVMQALGLMVTQLKLLSFSVESNREGHTGFDRCQKVEVFPLAIFWRQVMGELGRPSPGLDDYLYWQVRLANRVASGLSIDDFCPAEEVSRSAFYRWVDRLKDRIPEAVKGDQRLPSRSFSLFRSRRRL